MHACANITGSLPDWYLIERETERTIERLNSARELDYYINNPDEYIRRLAVLRLKKLGLRESGEILREIMDDPAETHANKLLAAWALKSMLAADDTFYMQSGRSMSDFTGYETYEELFPVHCEQNDRDISFRFSSSPSYNAFCMEDESPVLEKEISFKTDFDFRHWAGCFMSSLKANMTKLPAGILKSLHTASIKLMDSIKRISASLSEKKHSKPEKIKTAKKVGKKNGPLEGLRSGKEHLNAYAYPGDYSRLRKEIYDRPGFLSWFKKGVFRLFYFLFFPIRLARRHKIAFFLILVSVYAFFTYFSYGRAITAKYAGFDLREVQSRFLEQAKVLYSQAVDEIDRITGMDEWKKADISRKTSVDVLKTSDADIPKSVLNDDVIYIVTAKDGLNIRTAPDPSSVKVGSSALPYKTRVTFIKSALHESTGVEWFYVEAEDGRTGWVSSKYLRKEEAQY